MMDGWMAQYYLNRGLISVKFFVLGLDQSVSGQQSLAGEAIGSLLLHPLGQGLWFLAQGELGSLLGFLGGFCFQESFVLSLC